MELSAFCLTRGRYELAGDLLAIVTEWYEGEVVNKAWPRDTSADPKRYRQVLAQYEERLAELQLLVATRSRVLESLNDNAGGIDRDKLESRLKHDGSTVFGVICDQLARGGWLRQEKTRTSFMLYPTATPPPSDDVFVRQELPTPETLESQAASALPQARFNVVVSPEKRFGCLPRFFGSVLVVLTVIWGSR